MPLYKLTTTVLLVFGVMIGTAPGKNLTRRSFQLPRIVDGYPTTIDEHPHMVSFIHPTHKTGQTYVHGCGASIIGVYWILTAAHCTFPNPPPGLFRIRVGSSFLQQGEMYSLKSIVRHPWCELDAHNPSYDAALGQVERPIKMSSVVQPIPMVHTAPDVNSMVITTGWGLIHPDDADAPKQLREVGLLIIDHSLCKERNQVQGLVTDSMICAGVHEGHKGSCMGDSGGPLVYQGQLAGIVSWGVRCIVPGTFTVFTNVAMIREWITEVTGIY